MRPYILPLLLIPVLAIPNAGCSSSSAQTMPNPDPDAMVDIPGLALSNPRRLASDDILFDGVDIGAGSGDGIYLSNGTPEGTSLLMNFEINTSVIFDTNILPLFNGGHYFMAFTPSTGNELWFTDGTNTNTFLVEDTSPGSENSALRGVLSEPGLLTIILHVSNTQGDTVGTRILTFVDG